MKKSVFIFMFVFIFSVFLTLPVKAELVTSDYTTVLDTGENSLLMKETEGSEVKNVFIENINLMYHLALDVSCSYYLMTYPTADVGKEVTFYDGYLKKANYFNTSTTLYTNNLDGQHALPYAINYYRTSCAGAISVNPDATYATCADFVAALEEAENLPNYFKNITPDNDDTVDGDNSDKLPLPTFQIKQAFTIGNIGGSVKYTFNWSASEHEIYANNPNKYKIQMLASAKYTESTVLGTTSIVAEDINFINEDCKDYISSGIPIYKESYSFLEKTYREKLCEIAGCNSNYSSEASTYWFLFVRVIDPETQKTSLWKVYKCQGRNITPTGYSYDEEGNAYQGSDDDEVDYSPSYDSDPSTDDVDDPNSPSYNDGSEIDARHLLNNLEEIVETLKGIPELFQKIFLWMPDYLVVLIATSIGLIVVVGFVKMFLR